MPTIAKLSINLSATTALLRRDLNDSAKDFSQFKQTVDGGLKSLAENKAGAPLDMKLLAGAENLAKNVVGKLLTLAGAATVAHLSLGAMNAQMAAMDATGKLSDSLGTTTENLQRLRYAAALSGPGVAAADTALQTLVERLGDIRAGGGKEAAATLEKIGLNANTLARMDPTVAFGRIADGIRQLPTAADRASAAVNLFGRVGKDLLPTLESGSQGLAKMAREADRLGFAFSRADAAKIEEANDAITRLEMAWTAFVQQLSVTAAPALTRVTAALTEVTAFLSQIDIAMDGNTARVLAWGVALGVALGAISKYISFVNMATKALRSYATTQAIVNALSGPKGWLQLAAAAGIAAGAVYGLEKAFDKMDAASGNVTANVAQVSAAAQKAASKAKGELIELKGSFGVGWMDVLNAKNGSFQLFSDSSVTKDLSGLERAAIEKMNEIRDKANAPSPEAVAAQQRREEALRREAEQWKTIGERIGNSVATPAEKAKTVLAELNEALGRGVITADIYGRAVNNAMAEFRKAEMKDTLGNQRVSIGAVTRNSVAGFSAVQSGRDELRRLEQRAAEQLRVARRANELLAEIRMNTKEQVTFKKATL